MRLTSSCQNSIKDTFREVINDGEIYLFGSRVDDSKSGGKMAFNMTELTISIVVVIVLCIVGILHFRKTEKTFADVI